MPVRGIGVDVVKVERLVQSLERFGERMEKRLFTDGELEYCRRHKDPLPHLAARFAAKEAAFKAIGTGLSGGVGWKQAEVIQPGGHQPKLEFHGVALERFRPWAARQPPVAHARRRPRHRVRGDRGLMARKAKPAARTGKSATGRRTGAPKGVTSATGRRTGDAEGRRGRAGATDGGASPR